MQSCPKTCWSQPSVCTPYFPLLLRLTLDSEDFRRASLWLSPLGNLPPPYLTTDMLITVIYRNYFHLLLSTMKLYNSVRVQLFIPLTWIEHLLPITVLGIEEARVEFVWQIDFVAFWFWFENSKFSIHGHFFFNVLFLTEHEHVRQLIVLNKQTNKHFYSPWRGRQAGSKGVGWVTLGPNPKHHLWSFHSRVSQIRCYHL